MKSCTVYLTTCLLLQVGWGDRGRFKGRFLDNSGNPDDIHFYLYSFPGNVDSRDELIHNDTESLDNTPFKFGSETVILIPGYAKSNFPALVKNAYLKSSLNYNYIVVDWRNITTSTSTILRVPYEDIVLTIIPIIARRVADFIYFLRRNEATTLKLIHIVGHGLGAHVSGEAGLFIQNENGGEKVGRITGLDPTGPYFDWVQSQRTLRKGDADFVDIYHSAQGTWGTVHIHGNVDFFPNGGYKQPSCDTLDQDSLEEGEGGPLSVGTCSHKFVVDIYAATINKNFTACECKRLARVLNTCPNKCSDGILAGEPCSTNSRGQYYFKTSSTPSDSDP